MKTGHFEMITMLLAAVILMDVFQVKAEILDMADNAFDDEYLKGTDRMKTKFVPQLLKEEKSSSQLLETVWEDGKARWEAQKSAFSPMSFNDNHGIALMAYLSQAQEQTPFYHMFNEAVKMAGQSREDYIYRVQFKTFHFYLTRALQLLRSPCEDTYKKVVYITDQDTSFLFGGLNQARFGHFTLAYSARPQAVNDQLTLLTINTCFGVSIEKVLGKESKGTLLIPLNEIFHVSQEETGNSLLLQSTNRTCSHYECAFLGALNPSTLLPNADPESQPVHNCQEIHTTLTSLRADLTDVPLHNPDEELFNDGSSFVDHRVRARCTPYIEKISPFEIIFRRPPPVLPCLREVEQAGLTDQTLLRSLQALQATRHWLHNTVRETQEKDYSQPEYTQIPPGAKVLLKKRDLRTLEPCWDGPYTVILSAHTSCGKTSRKAALDTSITS
ncbi:ecto-ADP-ribosyltransferase 3-like [Rhynchocyon petersi]